ncbi:hypothetical protein [Stakelama saccharophila]|uniref:Lipoprotein n=1 Tax=Stakelama saccharophila TaxID=3075605 RepID=A0ABZ0BCU9_9SPHN|nr:hypothetical protein [Stakelama sp. W311]WNO54886.1 hypothetical protein RPR59_06475 [Stakelama sp. W311]
MLNPSARWLIAGAVTVLLGGCGGYFGGNDEAPVNSHAVAKAGDGGDGATDDGQEDDGPPIVYPTPAPAGTVTLPEPPREGRWTLQDTPDGPGAVFGRLGGEGMMAVTCERSRHMLRVRRTAVESNPDPVVALNLSLPQGRTLVRAFQEQDNAYRYTGRMPLRQPWLDVLLASSGTLESDLDGKAPLSVPVSDDLKRVVLACRGTRGTERGQPS